MKTNTKKPSIGCKSTTEHQPIPFVRPVLPAFEKLQNQYQKIMANGMVTTGPYAEELGEKIAGYLHIRHAVPVSSCTTGLVLAIQALQLPPGSEVILPSFTFMASATGVVWNQLKPRFADVDPDTLNLDVHSVESLIGNNTSAIAGVHLFGNPAPVDALQRLADRYSLALLFDSAHGFGTLHNDRPVGGYGSFEAFSMSPTKLLIAGEGGIVATNDDALAERIRFARNYGNPGNYDCLYNGINARMSEFHAICALHSFDMLEDAARQRNDIASYYKERLRNIPGITFQTVGENDRCSYKDFTIKIDEAEFGLHRDLVKQTLHDEGIQTRVYFSPVLHRMTAYRPYAEPDIESRLPNTVRLEEQVVSLPLYSDMNESEADIVCDALERIQANAK